MRIIKRLLWYQPGLVQAGGGERVILEGLKYFNEHGINAAIFVEDKPVAAEALFNNQYTPTVLRTEFPANNITDKKKNLLQKMRYFFLLKRSLREFDPDIIIANSQREALKVWLLLFSLFKRKIPFVCFIHGSFFQFPEETEKYALIYRKKNLLIREGDPVYKRLISAVPPSFPVFSRITLEIGSLLRYIAVRKARAVFVLTEKAKKEIQLLYRHPNVRAYHGAFSLDLLDTHLRHGKKKELGLENSFVILSLCRLVAKKHVDVIVKAFSIFVQKNPYSVLLIGGTGPEQKNLELLVKELQITDKVRFLGFIPEEELHDYYLNCNIFASADNADYDITSIVALALGKRVVASTQHEFDPEINKLNLLFHAEPTPEGFAQGFVCAMETSAKCDKLTKNEVMKTYSWEEYFSNIVATLNEIVTISS